MNRISAGILLFRIVEHNLEFFLVHPGGPFFKNKDEGHWTIPKGEPNENEDLQSCAIREFREETGLSVAGDLIELHPIIQKGGKNVFAWAVEGDIDADHLKSNQFEMEWPYKSGRIQRFPEIDKAAWFNIAQALEKINPAQQPFLQQAAQIRDIKL
ncbi:MAG TPA: NUDIX domain-containing protein [Flavitalea sp.]|nr:NUDIX domain-containing protein [Flavitalea sp.]